MKNLRSVMASEGLTDESIFNHLPSNWRGLKFSYTLTTPLPLPRVLSPKAQTLPVGTRFAVNMSWSGFKNKEPGLFGEMPEKRKMVTVTYFIPGREREAETLHITAARWKKWLKVMDVSEQVGKTAAPQKVVKRTLSVELLAVSKALREEEGSVDVFVAQVLEACAHALKRSGDITAASRLERLVETLFAVKSPEPPHPIFGEDDEFDADAWSRLVD